MTSTDVPVVERDAAAFCVPVSAAVLRLGGAVVLGGDAAALLARLVAGDFVPALEQFLGSAAGR